MLVQVLIGKEWVQVYYDNELFLEVSLGDPDLNRKVRREVKDCLHRLEKVRAEIRRLP